MSPLLVDLASMTDTDEDENELSVSYISKDSIITHTVAPLAAPVGSQRFTVDSWVPSTHEILFNP